jgi:hypothetical protein
MDYNKIADILAYISIEAESLVEVEYLPIDFWAGLVDELKLAEYVTAEWATLTSLGEFQIEYAWRELCEMREIDPEVMYDSVIDFFKAQETKE